LQSFFVYTPEQTLSLLLNRKEIVLVKGWANSAGRNDEAVTSLEKNKLRVKGFDHTVKTWEGGDSVLIDLEALINLLQSHKVTPILITFPNYSLMRSFLYPSLVERNRNVGRELSQKYQIPYLDYFDDESFTVEDYFNCDHLNAQGAAKLSEKINAVIMDMELKKLD
jgi:lysophospholipase L1-like esterase